MSAHFAERGAARGRRSPRVQACSGHRRPRWQERAQARGRHQRRHSFQGPASHQDAAKAHRNGAPGCSFSAFVTTLETWRVLSLCLQNWSHAVQMARSPLNLRVARSKMKWMRRTMP